MQPSYFFDIKLPGFPGNKKYQEEFEKEQREFLAKIISAKKANPDAERICLGCFTPIFEKDAKCPNCDDYGQREEEKD